MVIESLTASHVKIAVYRFVACKDSRKFDFSFVFTSKSEKHHFLQGFKDYMFIHTISSITIARIVSKLDTKVPQEVLFLWVKIFNQVSILIKN